MKKLWFVWLALTAFSLPSFAQETDNVSAPYEVIVPDKGFTLKKSQVPASVLEARNTDFKMNDPVTWTKFPYSLKDYGWEYDASDKVDYYKVSMRAANNKMIYAVYSAKGDLIATKEETTNAELPSYVLESFSKSKYKDWQIIGNKEIIKFYNTKNSVQQVIRLEIKKGSQVKHINFNYEVKMDK